MDGIIQRPRLYVLRLIYRKLHKSIELTHKTAVSEKARISLVRDRRFPRTFGFGLCVPINRGVARNT